MNWFDKLVHLWLTTDSLPLAMCILLLFTAACMFLGFLVVGIGGGVIMLLGG